MKKLWNLKRKKTEKKNNYTFLKIKIKNKSQTKRGVGGVCCPNNRMKVICKKIGRKGRDEGRRFLLTKISNTSHRPSLERRPNQLKALFFFFSETKTRHTWKGQNWNDRNFFGFILFYLQKPESMRQIVTRCREEPIQKVFRVRREAGGGLVLVTLPSQTYKAETKAKMIYCFLLDKSRYIAFFFFFL